MRSIHGVMTFFNEELLIGDWINWHKDIFEKAILINHHSTDRSVEIAESLKPDGWVIVNSNLSDFNARDNDREVERVENTLPGEDWKMALNVTEYIFTPDLRTVLSRLEREHPLALAFGARSYSIIDKEETIELKFPLLKHHIYGIYDSGGRARRWRFIHKSPNGNYDLGRHDVGLPNIGVEDLKICHFNQSPWPQCKERKLQIQTRIPECDKAARLGFEHIANDAELTKRWEESRPVCYNLLTDPDYKERYDRFFPGN